MIVYIPSVRTESQPMRVLATVATNTAMRDANHQGQPRLICVAALVANMAKQ